MITPIDDILREIPKYDDSLLLAEDMKTIAQAMIQAGQPRAAADLSAVAQNLIGMHQLLRSVRHHLAIKALDGC